MADPGRVMGFILELQLSPRVSRWQVDDSPGSDCPDLLQVQLPVGAPSLPVTLGRQAEAGRTAMDARSGNGDIQRIRPGDRVIAGRTESGGPFARGLLGDIECHRHGCAGFQGNRRRAFDGPGQERQFGLTRRFPYVSTEIHGCRQHVQGHRCRRLKLHPLGPDLPGPQILGNGRQGSRCPISPRFNDR